MREFKVGDNVVLTEAMRRAAYHPEKYKSGVVTGVGSWGIIYVAWNGIDRPIGVRSDEIELTEG